MTPQPETNTAFDRAKFLVELASGKPKESEITEEVYRWAFQIDPENVAAMNGLGRCALARKEWTLAKSWFQRAMIMDRSNPFPRVNASITCVHLGQYNEAGERINTALELDPSCLQAHIQKISLLSIAQDPEGQQAAIDAALELHPGNHDLLFSRACLRLSQGDFEGGWLDYEHRPTRLQLASALDEFAEWDGSDPRGKTILVAREQGLGDSIMFARYLPLLRKMGAKVILYTYPELARLLAPLVDQVVTVDKDIPEFDCWVADGSLPLKIYAGPEMTWDFSRRTGIHDDPDGFARHPQYLLPESADIDRFQSLIPNTGNLRVGLCWKGNPKHSWDDFRSIPFGALAPILEVSGCDFYSLQYGDKESGLTRLLDYTHDLADAAAAIQNLDLVITCDTSIAHLAGALGKPVWILLGVPGDWRWENGGRTPWYPSAFLLGGGKPKDWESQIAKAALDLNGVNDGTFSLYQGWRQIIAEHMSAARRALPPMPVPSPLVTRECRYGMMTWLRNDHYIGRSLDLYGEYSESEMELLRKVVEPGNTVIEAGANIGGLTVPLVQLVGPGGILYAFEPQPKYFDCLGSNLLHNAESWRAPQALGAENAQLTLRSVEQNRIHAPGWKATGREFEVDQVTIDSLKLTHCHLIKIDVDGQELDILKGAEATIERCRPFLYVENDKPDQYPDLIPWLDRHGYRLYQHYARLFNPNNFRGNPVNVFGGIVSAMLLCVPTERKDVHPEAWGLSRVRVTRQER